MFMVAPGPRLLMTVLAKGHLSSLHNVTSRFFLLHCFVFHPAGVFVPCDLIMQRAHWKLQFQDNRIELLTHWD